jgi:hypothetical protein
MLKVLKIKVLAWDLALKDESKKTDITTINPICIIIEWLLLRFFTVVVCELLRSEGV